MGLRIATGLPLLVIAFGVMVFPRTFSAAGWVAFAVVLVVATITLWELQRLLGLVHRDPHGRPVIPVVASFAFLWLYLLMVQFEQWEALPLWIFGLLFVQLIPQLSRFPLEEPFLQRPLEVWGSTLFIGMGFGALFQVHDLNEVWIATGITREVGGFVLTGLIPLIGTWGYDSAALFAGLATGTLPMTPAISPKKTWEGLAGGLIGAAGMMMLAAALFWPQHAGQPATGAVLFAAALLGILLGLASQLGDLTISCLKRQADRKDSSSLIPSQGGLLDKYDGLLFVLPSSLALLLLLTRLL